MRWPPANPSDVSTFNQGVLTSFPRPRYRSPPTTASTLRHYSPLQQNYHRAVDPTTIPSDHASDHRHATSESPITMSLLPTNPRDLFAGGREVEAQKEDTSTKGEDGKDEEDELAQMSKYSVKTLTNLASYTNPHQKVAQRALDRARETFRAAPDMSRPIGTTSSRQGLDGAGILTSTSLLPPGRDGSDHFGRLPRHGHINSSTRSSVLSNGPGAPQPLTAGPPGQRQYKASTLEGPLRALQVSAQKPPPPPLIDEAHFDINPSSLLDTGPQSSASENPDLPHSPDQKTEAMLSVCQSPFQGARRNITWTKGITETKTPSQLKQYYNGGAPSDYDAAKYVSVPDNDNSDLMAQLQPRDPRQPPSAEARAQRDAWLRVAFYAGTSDLTKTWNERFDEIRKKLQDQELGISDSAECSAAVQNEIHTSPNSEQLGKPKSFSVEVFNPWPTHEAAEPLVSMAYSSLAKYWDNGRIMSIPTGFAKVQQPEDDDLWARTRGMNPPPYAPQPKNRWGAPQTLAPSRFIDRSQDV